MNINAVKDALIKIKGDKKSLFIIILGVLGLVFIMLADTSPAENKSVTDDLSTYTISQSDLCHELENLIQSIDGAGKTKVMLTFESSAENVFAANLNESTSADGDIDTNKEYIIIDGNDGESGMRIKYISPKIRGVAIVCRGGNNPVIKEQIISAVSALFDISSNKISVAVMAK